MGKIYTSAEQLIGGTPLLELTHLERELGLIEAWEGGGCLLKTDLIHVTL